MTLSINRKALILVSVPLLFEIVLVGVLLRLTTVLDEARKAESHGRELTTHLNNIEALQIERIGYLLTRFGKFPDQRLKQLEANHQTVRGHAEAIDRLVVGHPVEEEKWKRIRYLIFINGQDLDGVVEEFAGDHKQAAALHYVSVQRRMDEILSLTKELCDQQTIVGAEQQLFLDRGSQEQQLILKLALLSSILLALGLAFYFNKGTSRRLKTLMENTARLSAGLAPDSTIKGNDELAAIDSTYHRMYSALTQLRQKERATIDNAADIICSIDADLRLTDVNPAATTLLGFSQEYLLGRRVIDLVALDDQGSVLASFKQLQAGAEAAENAVSSATSSATANFPARMVRLDQSVADTSWAVTAAFDSTLYCVIHDETERKRVEQLKQEFVAMVGHDLRSPLTSIQMALSMLEEDASSDLSPDFSDTMAIAQNNISRLMALVNNLLDLERLELGPLGLSLRDANLKELIGEAVNAVLGIARQQKFSIVQTVPENLSAYIDRDKVIQVIVNLLTNSLKFSPKGSTVTIDCEPQGKFVRIKIADMGRGIPQELALSVFERRRQVLPTDASVHQGYGLGLAICKAIVESHFGEIAVEANHPVGSVFWFTLPASEEAFMDFKAASSQS
ncbi:hypothetical protein BH11CYA1_BH11CYA1_08600 [soil metagenome]